MSTLFYFYLARDSVVQEHRRPYVRHNFMHWQCVFVIDAANTFTDCFVRSDINGILPQP